MGSPAVIICVFALVGWVVYRCSRIGARESYLPPGPPTIPLLGNLLDFPTSYAHLQFTEWAKQYGDIYSLKLATSNIIVISSAKMARDFLELRGSTTADRPPSHVAKIVYGEYELVFARHGPVWRKLRRVIHEILTREKCAQHVAVQKAEVSQLMYDILERPEDFYTHTRRFAASVILAVVFGIHCPTYENGFVAKLYSTLWEWEQVIRPGGVPPVDIFPILKYVPERWAAWKALCRDIRKNQRKIFFGLLDICEDRMNQDRRNDCFLEHVLDKREEYGLDCEMIAYVGGTLLEAGTETSAVNIQSFLEIDDVVGPSRTPELDDLDGLPYVRAIIKEVFRLRPIGPTGVPHATTADERIGPYVIPKGTTIFVNLWGIFRDEELYDNPHQFNPNRFLTSKFGTKPGADTTGCRNDLVFGSGRRICPGLHLANNSISSKGSCHRGDYSSQFF
ncbi:unnamed protein product [Somion occarium]|uniref:Cytochrome P450 n=1 Tax=Somion occarium TaxID=3059160 RepID=A0ABP1DLB6_9APHY